MGFRDFRSLEFGGLGLFGVQAGPAFRILRVFHGVLGVLGAGAVGAWREDLRT